MVTACFSEELFNHRTFRNGSHEYGRNMIDKLFKTFLNIFSPFSDGFGKFLLSFHSY